MQTALTRKQLIQLGRLAKVAPGAAEVLITGDRGDLTVAVLDAEGTNLETFTLHPDGKRSYRTVGEQVTS